MESTALDSAALALAGALVYFLICARRNRPRDKYKDTLRELSGPTDGYEAIEPAGDPQEAIDRTVDSVSRGFDIVNVIQAIFLVGVVIFLAVTDPITRIIVLAVLAVLTTIWIVGRKLGK